MGYTHSWGWTDTIPNAEQFPLWSADVARLLACYKENPPSNPWEDEPWFRFHPNLYGQWDTTICGPYGFDAPIIRPDFVAYKQIECFICRGKHTKRKLPAFPSGKGIVS